MEENYEKVISGFVSRNNGAQPRGMRRRQNNSRYGYKSSGRYDGCRHGECGSRRERKTRVPELTGRLKAIKEAGVLKVATSPIVRRMSLKISQKTARINM